MEADKETLFKAMIALFVKRRQIFRKKLAFFVVSFNILAHRRAKPVRNISRLLLPEIHERQVWKYDRSSTFWEKDVSEMSDAKFKENFRMTRKSFVKLCEIVQSMRRKDTQIRECIPLEKRIGIALYALGSSAEYRTVSHLFAVGLSTVSDIVLEFCNVVCNELKDYISSYPPNEEEIQRVVRGFEQLGFPQCFGALDGCHIEIRPYQKDAVDYYNYKGWYSVVLLAACDHRSKFTYLNIGSAGKNNDSYIFESSSLKRFHDRSQIFNENSKSIGGLDVPVLLIGDPAFRLSRYMMKPFPYSTSQPQIEKNFNYRLSRCRRVIENAFGQLKARFRKLGKGLELAPEHCNDVIHACCLLHKFLKVEEDYVLQVWIDEYADSAKSRNVPNHTTKKGQHDEDAKAIRKAIASSFEDELSSEFDGNEHDDIGEISGSGTVEASNEVDAM